jgi:hypothetical protein
LTAANLLLLLSFLYPKPMRTSSVIGLFLLLILFADPLRAQDNYLEQKIGWRGNGIELHSITDKAKQRSCTFVVGSDSIRALIADNQLLVVQQFSIPRLPNEQVLGGFFKEDRIYLFTEGGGMGDNMHRWEMNIATGQAMEIFIPLDLKKERVVDRISGGDHFLYFTVDKQTAEFIIYDFNQSPDYSTLRYKFGEGIWKDLTNIGFFKRSIDVEKVDVEEVCALDVAVNKNKLYLHNDTLLLIMNNHLDSTQVFSFDLQHKKVNDWLIKHGSGSTLAETNSVAHNSFLLGDNLYYVRATYDNLLLEVVNLHGGAALKTFFAGKEEPISFKNTSIIQEGTASSATAFRELENTGQLLRKMVNGEAVINAAPIENGQIRLTVGSFAKVKGSSGKTGIMPGAAPGAPDRTTNLDGMWTPFGNWTLVGGFRRNTWTKSARFITLLNGNTFEHVDGEAGWSISERIEKYAEEIKIPPRAESLFKMNGHCYYAFYDKRDYRLVILEF